MPLSQKCLAHFARAFLESQDGLHEAVIVKLIASYVNFTNQSEQPYVLRKVCSTLAAYFLHPNSSWQFPVRHVLKSLCDGQVAEHGGLDTVQEIWSTVPHVKPSQLRGVLWLASSLIEELTKLDVKGTERSVSRSSIIPG